MASLQERNGVWNCIFRYQGKRHWYNIGEIEESEAQAVSARVDYLLLRLKQHLIEIPAGCDIVTFIEYDGKPPSPEKLQQAQRQSLTLTELRDKYLAVHGNGTLEDTTLAGMRQHFKHWITTLGAGHLVGSLTMADLQGHVDRRAKMKGIRGLVSPATIQKEIITLRTSWNWGVRFGLLTVPEGVPEADCHLSHTRPVWRLELNRALVVAYEIYRGPKSQYGQIPGVLGRSEFGVEIVVEIAHLVYVIGLSFDKVCQTLQFLQNLSLGKTQADSLLKQLSRHWQHEFDVLCTLLANSMVVHADETSWSINSVWTFLSEKARVLFFGVHKDAKTLEKILDPKTFLGIVISDDAAVYANFTHSQKCWAHLLRKAFKLTLQEPNNQEYREFADRLLAIYREACRVQKDARRSMAGRSLKVAELDDEILDLCFPLWQLDLPPLEKGPENDYRLLVGEVMRVMLAKQLFTFVTAEPATQPNGKSQPVAGTNNEAERTQRNTTAARDTGRANKTPAGARRQTIIVSVLESLRVYLKDFTLTNVIAEIERWRHAGESCFSKLLRKLKLKVPDESILDKLVPIPDG